MFELLRPSVQPRMLSVAADKGTLSYGMELYLDTRDEKAALMSPGISMIAASQLSCNDALRAQSHKREVGDEKRLRLLKDVSGAFRPSVLTALVGVSGAGKTTLMDVLAGRKTGACRKSVQRTSICAHHRPLAVQGSPRTSHYPCLACTPGFTHADIVQCLIT